MKLLGWMHRKFRQNSSEPFKDLVVGHSCNCVSGQPAVDDEPNYFKPNFGTKHVKDHSHIKSFAGLEGARAEDDEYEEESSGGMYELFHGFLTIGTLGSEQVATDPSTTPTFAFYVENITEKEDAVTENELKLINDELEKVLGAESKDDGSNYDSSSGRNSHVSTGRSSHGSTITVSGKPAMESNTTSAVCPLQGYLFGSAVELSETTKAAKKEHRTSLGELFQRSKLAEDHFGSKDDKKIEREADKSANAIHLMKKMLKKRMRSSTSTSGGPVDSASSEKKLHKILHMLFHRKVHPEYSTAARKNEIKKKMMNEGRNNKSDPEEDNNNNIMLHSKRAVVAKDGMRQYKSQSNPFQFTLGSEDSCEREHWIKTDADYLVLEL